MTLCIGIGISRGANNDCLLRLDGVFVQSVRTRTKLDDDKEKRMRFLLQMLQLFYTLMMDKEATIYGIPFQQHLELITLLTLLITLGIKSNSVDHIIFFIVVRKASVLMNDFIS